MTEKQKTRTKKNKRAPKGTADVERNVDGVAKAEPVVYEAGNVQRGDHDITGYYRWNNEQVMFLDEYAKDCDHKRAAAALGLDKRTVERWIVQEKFKAEIMEIQEVWRLNMKMTAERAAARHIKLMNKLEADYDKADPDLRAKLATPLMKGSETYLKAAGHFNHGGGTGSESQVVINIVGVDEEKIDISGEKK